MEPNGTAQYEFEHMSIQINWTEFILKEAEAHQSVEIKKWNVGLVEFMWAEFN